MNRFINLTMLSPRRVLPLQRYALFETQDVDDARERVARVFCPHRLDLVAPHSTLDARQHSVLLHRDVHLNYVQYGAAVDIEPGYLGSFYLLQIPLFGSAEVRCGNQVLVAQPHLASLPSPTEPLRMRWASDSPHLILRLEQTAVQRQWEHLHQAALKRPLVFDLGVDLRQAELAPLCHFIHYLYATLDEHPGFTRSALAAQAEAYLLDSLLGSLAHNQTTSSRTDIRPSLMPRSVRRAQEYMRSHVQDAASLAELCSAMGVSLRSLQTAFQTHVGQSPMAYWRGLRLDQVHQALSRSGERQGRSITELAFAYGFLHMGHFTQHYRQRFGQTPTQTLGKRPL